LLQQANKELTGDSSHTRSELIELENTVRKCRGEGAWPAADDCGTHTVVHAAAAYRKYLADCNLVDSWAVWDTFREILTSGDEATRSSAKYRLLVLKPLDAEEWERVSALGSIASARRLEIVEGRSREAAVISENSFLGISLVFCLLLKKN
jgi:hypothetical protein